MNLPIQIKVGGGGTNPVAGATEWNYPLLKGITGYISKGGFGIWGFENYQVLASGGIRLLNGLEFSADDDLFFVPLGLYYSTTTSGGYTNGFNTSLVLSKLIGRLGWIQTAEAFDLDAINSTSKSGRYFNDGSFHAIVTLKNIYDTMEQKNATAEQANAFLLMTYRAIILRSLNGVFSEPEYVSQSLVYNRLGRGNNDQPVTNGGKFVGYQIKAPSSTDFALQINSLSLYFNEAKTFNIYVFNDVKLSPIYTKEVTSEAFNQVTVELEDFILNYVGPQNLSGVFYIGYFQDDLGTAKAIWETDVEFLNYGFYGITPIESAKTGAQNFNRNTYMYNVNQTHGLNMHISVFKDHTQSIINKAHLFDNISGLQMAAQVFEAMQWTTRRNDTERILMDDATKLNASLELTGVAPITSGPKTTGLRKMIEQETLRTKLNFFPKQKLKSISIC